MRDIQHEEVLMKAFLIIGNLNAVTYKEVFPLIKDGKVRLGVNSVKTFIMQSGDTQKFGNIGWFTTLTHDHINPPLTLTATYTPEAYPRYDNYDAIEVSRTEDIPVDYDGVMGVPITFLGKWCTEQFEIVGTDEDNGQGLSFGLWNGQSRDRHILINGKRNYSRLFIIRK